MGPMYEDSEETFVDYYDEHGRLLTTARVKNDGPVPVPREAVWVRVKMVPRG